MEATQLDKGHRFSSRGRRELRNQRRTAGKVETSRHRLHIAFVIVVYISSGSSFLYNDFGGSGAVVTSAVTTSTSLKLCFSVVINTPPPE